MENYVYDQLAEADENHWWFHSRIELVAQALKHCQAPARFSSALEVGCGPGLNINFLHQIADQVVGIDFSQHAVDLGKKKYPNAQFLVGDANELARVAQPATFDLICFFNVLYHEWIRDEKAVLDQAFTLLRPGGTLIITDAAFQWLSRRHDRVSFGKRRFSKRMLRQLVLDSHFEVSFISYFNFFAVAPALILKVVDFIETKFFPKVAEHEAKSIGELKMPPLFINKLLRFVMAVERFWILKIGPVPAGVSILCIARKPGK